MIGFLLAIFSFGCAMFFARAGDAATVDEVVKKSASLSGAQRKAFLEEGAKKEGEIVFYTSLSLTDYPKIMPHFEKTYPFIKTNTFRATPSGVFTRVETEARAGRFAVDVVGSALAKQDLQMPGSSSVMRVQLMLAGESAIALAARGRRVTEYKQQGAPIDFRIMDPYGGEPNFIALIQRSAHPHAALLFIDWILSEEGQARLADAAGRISIRKGIKHKPWVQELFQKDFVFLSPSTVGPNLNSIIDSIQPNFRRAQNKIVFRPIQTCLSLLVEAARLGLTRAASTSGSNEPKVI